MALFIVFAFSGLLSALLLNIDLCAYRRTSSFGFCVFDPSLLACPSNSIFVLTAPLRPLQQLPLERASGFVLDFGLLFLTDLCCACVFFYITSLRGSRLDSLLEGFSSQVTCSMWPPPPQLLLRSVIEES